MFKQKNKEIAYKILKREEERKEKAAKLREQELRNLSRARAIEERQMVISQVVEEKHEQMQREMLKKSEANRLKDLDAQINYGRRQRMQVGFKQGCSQRDSDREASPGK